MTEKRLSIVLATANLLTRFASSSTNFSTTHIAKAASVTQPLVYHYFPAKKGGKARLVQEAYQYLVDNSPEQAQRVKTREDLMEDSFLNVTLPEEKSEILQVVEETAQDLGIDLQVQHEVA